MCCQDLTDRLLLANQHMQIRHATLSASSFFLSMISFQWTLTHQRGQFDCARVREKHCDKSVKNMGAVTLCWTLCQWAKHSLFWWSINCCHSSCSQPFNHSVLVVQISPHCPLVSIFSHYCDEPFILIVPDLLCRLAPTAPSFNSCHLRSSYDEPFIHRVPALVLCRSALSSTLELWVEAWRQLGPPAPSTNVCLKNFPPRSLTKPASSRPRHHAAPSLAATRRWPLSLWWCWRWCW